MCTHKLYIRNKKLNPDWKSDKQFIRVPCGNCEECINKRRCDLYTRAWWETHEVKIKGGQTLFLTLTYNEQNIPKFNGEYCFDKEQTQKFLHKLHEFIRRHNLGKEKYLITTEFGEKTMRPHLHMLLHWIPNKDFSATKLYKKVCELWNKGFVTGGRKGIIVKDTQAVGYVTKYVIKGTQTPSYYDILPTNAKLFTLTSMHYGEGLIHSEMLDIEKGTIRIEKDGKYVINYLPNYILRKIYYTTYKNENGNNSYQINELGKQRLKNIMKEYYDTECKKWTDIPNDQEFLELAKERGLNEVIKQNINHYNSILYKNILRDRQVFKGIQVNFEEETMNDISNLILWENDVEVCNQTYNSLFSDYEQDCKLLELAETWHKYQAYKTRTEAQNAATRVNNARNRNNPNYKQKPIKKILSIYEYLKQDKTNQQGRMEYKLLHQSTSEKQRRNNS